MRTHTYSSMRTTYTAVRDTHTDENKHIYSTAEATYIQQQMDTYTPSVPSRALNAALYSGLVKFISIGSRD